MVPLSKYVTRQRKLLLSYLCRHPDEQLSVQEITQALEGESISVSAVYRNLADLEAEGKLRRTSRGGAREVYYQFTGADACLGCLHLSCKRCGRTFHMDSAGAEELVHNVEKRQGFEIDRADTVLFGVCLACRERDEEGA